MGVGNSAVLVVASRIRKFAEDTEFLLSGVRKYNVAATQEADLQICRMQNFLRSTKSKFFCDFEEIQLKYE